MKKLFLSLLVLLAGITALCTTWTINNSGFTFSPSTITIIIGDDVNFSLAGIHNAVEVSQATWDINGNTPLPGGFQTSFGGGSVTASQLGVGTHYYVCSPHASLGMKGIIVVQNTTDIDENQSEPILLVYPIPSNNILTIKVRSEVIGYQFQITDKSGRQMTNGKLADETSLIDISQLNPGIYLFQIIGKRNQTIKVIKN
jgi:plastocyanin